MLSICKQWLGSGLVWLGLFLTALTTAAQGQYRFDQWTTANGLPQNSVRAVLQTPDGYLWLSTMDGLARFDGVRFTVFDKGNTPGINSNRFIALYLDSAGTLWAGTENGGVTRYQHGRFTTFNTQHGLPSNLILGLTGDATGNVWVLAGDQLARWQDGHFVAASPPGWPAEIKARGWQASFWDCKIFYTVTDQRIYRFAGGPVTSFQLPATLPAKLVNIVAENGDGTLWVWTYNRKLVRVKDGQVLAEAHISEIAPDARPLSFTRPAMQFIERDRQQRAWQMEVGPDLYRLLTFTSSGQPTRLTMRTFFEDREGHIWLGNDGFGLGLMRMRKQDVTVYSTAQGLVDNNVYPLLEDHTGAVWIGAWPNGLSRFQDGRFTNFTVANGLMNSVVTALAEDRDKQLWIGLRHGSGGAVMTYADGRFTERRELLPYFVGGVNAIHQDREGVMWFGTMRGLVRWQQGVAQVFNVAEGLPGEDVRVILEAAGGGLWLGTYSGLVRYEKGRFSSWTERDGLPSNSVRALYEEPDGTLWIGTYDGGLGRFKAGRFTRYTVAEGLHNNGVFQILEDARGNFWMGSNRGIYRVAKAELNDFAEGRQSGIHSIAYGKGEGLLNEECNGGHWPSGVKTRTGQLYFPTQDGVAVIDPAQVSSNKQPPTVLIESFLLERNPVDFSHPVQIKPGQENFEIGYTALSFENPEQIRFKYRLIGLDSHWIEAGTRRTAYFSHVPPGTYTFQVIAANSAGVWNMEGQRLRLLVRSPFYRTWWFLGFLTLTVGGLIFGLYEFRVSQLRQRQTIQEAFSQQLIGAQETERQRIASGLHDSLGQQLLVIKNWAQIELRLLPPDNHSHEALQEINSVAAQAIEEVREIIYDLRPYQLDKIGLTNTLRFMIEKVSGASQLKCQMDLADLSGLFTREDEITFYRIVQEGLNNICKHAEASIVRVLIEREARLVKLSIEDNGRGFLLTQPGVVSPTRGFGLTGLQERARMLGGELQILSAPGQGTQILLLVEGTLPDE